MTAILALLRLPAAWPCTWTLAWPCTWTLALVKLCLAAWAFLLDMRPAPSIFALHINSFALIYAWNIAFDHRHQHPPKFFCSGAILLLSVLASALWPCICSLIRDTCRRRFFSHAVVTLKPSLLMCHTRGPATATARLVAPSVLQAHLNDMLPCSSCNRKKLCRCSWQVVSVRHRSLFSCHCYIPMKDRVYRHAPMPLLNWTDLHSFLVRLVCMLFLAFSLSFFYIVAYLCEPVSRLAISTSRIAIPHPVYLPSHYFQTFGPRSRPSSCSQTSSFLASSPSVCARRSMVNLWIWIPLAGDAHPVLHADAAR